MDLRNATIHPLPEPLSSLTTQLQATGAKLSGLNLKSLKGVTLEHAVHGLTHGTLQRGVRIEPIASGSQGEVKGLVAVEVTDGNALVRRRPQEGRFGLEVILAKGRRIALSRDFDAVQLRRAVEVLEGF